MLKLWFVSVTDWALICFCVYNCWICAIFTLRPSFCHEYLEFRENCITITASMSFSKPTGEEIQKISRVCSTGINVILVKSQEASLEIHLLILSFYSSLKCLGLLLITCLPNTYKFHVTYMNCLSEMNGRCIFKIITCGDTQNALGSHF